MGRIGADGQRHLAGTQPTDASEYRRTRGGYEDVNTADLRNVMLEGA